MFEFRRGLENQPHLWFEGHYFRIDDRDDEAAAVRKIEEGVGALGGNLGWTLPFVRQLLALPTGDEAAAALDAASRRAQTFGALKAITLQGAQLRPLVLVIEDLHWIDPESEEFLSFLGDAMPATSALLVCSHRPGYWHPFGDRSYHVRVTLRPLSSTEMSGMTTALLGGVDLPDAVRDLVERKAEGNPFFVEEVTKSLLEQARCAPRPASSYWRKRSTNSPCPTRFKASLPRVSTDFPTRGGLLLGGLHARSQLVRSGTLDC